MSTGNDIAAVVAAHNEEAGVAQVVSGLLSVLPDGCEVLVVDDGSEDRTAQRAEEAGARVLRLKPNRGKGAALRAGISATEAEILVFIDADGQDEPAELPVLLEAMASDVALVIGSRFLGTLEDGSIKALNLVGNKCLTGLFNLLYGARITDTQAGFRVLRRSAIRLEELRARRYEIETEMTLHVLRRGGRVVEVPVTRRARAGGQTGFEIAYDGLRILSCMLTSRLASFRGRGGSDR